MKKAVILFVVLAFVALVFSYAFAERTGKDIYESICFACHGTGMVDAPVFGTPDWAALAKKGIDKLLENAIAGVGDMPPRGSCGDCSDAELKAAIQHMLDSVR